MSAREPSTKSLSAAEHNTYYYSSVCFLVSLFTLDVPVVRNAIVWLLTSFRDYILIPLKNAFVYIADMFYKCCSFVYRTVREFVLVPIKNAVVWIAKSFRDYVLIPLKNTAVYIATRIYEGFCFTGRSIRDYILIPLKNTAVYIATRIYEWFCFTGRSTRDYLLIPIRNFLLFLGTR